MALFDEDEATELRELFAAMDDADAEEAAEAMAAAAKLLRRHDYSFRHMVQEIDARGMLFPTKIAAAIRLMDSTTLSEAKSAFAGARRLMKGCGLTFAAIIGALDRQPFKAEDIQDLKFAYKIEVERAREMEAELQKLRANAAAVAAAAAAAMSAPSGEPASEPAATASPFRNVMVAAMLVLGIVLAVSIVSTFADVLRSANATATASGSLLPTVASTFVQRTSLSPSRTGWNCWRNRATQGPCF